MAASANAENKEPTQRALFVSVISDPLVLGSRDEIEKLITFARRNDIKIFFIQVYRSNQSWFPSEVADAKPYQKCLESVGQDPLALLIEGAHHQGIEVHAWLNLMSLGVNRDANFIKKYGTSVLTRNRHAKNKFEDYKIDSQYFLEPGDPRVREDLAKIVTEIVATYPTIDGIQFDYIRYPDFKPQYGYTSINMERFKKAADVKTIDENDPRWKNWKRDQVTELLSLLGNTARSLNPKIQVSTTGCMPYSRAYHEAFQDWASWIDKGLVNFVTMMNYSEDPDEYARWNESIKNKGVNLKKLKIGVGAYKFVNSPEPFGQELRNCEQYGTTCAIFHYGSLMENPKLGEQLWQ